MNAMVSLTKTTPICSLCRDGCALILKPALFLATNFLNLLGWCCGFFTMFWVGGCIPCGDSFTSTLYFCKTNERNIERRICELYGISASSPFLARQFYIFLSFFFFFWKGYIILYCTGIFIESSVTFIFLIYILHIFLISLTILSLFW